MDKPHAVIKDDDGEVEGCHATEDAAKKQMAALYAREGKGMETIETPERGYLQLKATTEVATEQGEFVAVISTPSSDREKDIVEPMAMVAALKRWADVGKLVPLAWDHSTKAEDQIGHIKPTTVKIVNGEVQASGWIDQSIDVGKHAWRLVKAGTLGFSWKYLIPEGGAVKRARGGLRIKELDIFEVTATPHPMNHETRVIGWKSAAEQESPSEAELARREQEQRLGEATKDVPKGTEPAPDPVEQLQTQVKSLQEELEALRTKVGEDLEGIKAAVEEPKEANSAKHDPLRKRSDQAVLEIQSDGISLRKSPIVRQEPAPKPAPEAELKARSRREMLELLTGVPYDTQREGTQGR